MDSRDIRSSFSAEIEDQVLAGKIEQLIQQNENISIPAVVMEYTSKENIDFDYIDMKNFFGQFGKVEAFEIKGKICIALYNSFFSANLCREILSNENNLKDNMKNNIIVRWFKSDKDEAILSKEQKEKFDFIIAQKQSQNIKNQIGMQMNKPKQIIQNPQYIPVNQMRNPMMANQFIPPNMPINRNPMQNMGMMQNGMNMPNVPMNNFYQNPNFMINQMMLQKQMGGQNPKMNMMNQPFPYQNQNMNFNNNQQKPMNMQDQNNNNFYEGKSTYGKFTCKFEILIPNDQEFQVVRRLIGSKGCNMKRIVDSCKSDQGEVKLRLRGRGSGYKEGPENKESDDPLHLCISATNQEGLKKACGLVTELINKIYEEYKKYCNKIGIVPLPKIANRIDGTNTFHNKNNMNHY